MFTCNRMSWDCNIVCIGSLLEVTDVAEHG